MKILKNLLALICIALCSTTLSFGQVTPNGGGGTLLTYENGYHVGFSLAMNEILQGYYCRTTYSSWPSEVKTTIQQYKNSGDYEYAFGVEDGFTGTMPGCSYESNEANGDPTGECTTCQTWEWEP